MADTDDKTTSPPIVPLMATGNSLTDLEIAREQSAVIEADATAGQIAHPELPPMENGAGGSQAEAPDAPVDDDRPTLSE